MGFVDDEAVGAGLCGGFAYVSEGWTDGHVDREERVVEEVR